jgi:hypothetical protein
MDLAKTEFTTFDDQTAAGDQINDALKRYKELGYPEFKAVDDYTFD